MQFSRTLGGLLAAFLLATAPLALAAPDEIQVYTEEMDDPGEFGLELHVNYAIKGATEATYEGEKPGHHMLQITPEFSYGITKTLEAGMYVPFAIAPDGNLYNNGLRLRLKFIAPHAEKDYFFWGLNTELGYFSRRVSDSYWGMELRPIFGYRSDDWLVSFNPIANTNLSENADRKLQFEPGLKVTRKVDAGINAGLEYYGEYGPLSRFAPSGQRSHSVYAVVDVEKGDFDVNFGIGRGFGETPDKWVAKAIIAFPFK